MNFFQPRWDWICICRANPSISRWFRRHQEVGGRFVGRLFPKNQHSASAGLSSVGFYQDSQSFKNVDSLRVNHHYRRVPIFLKLGSIDLGDVAIYLY